MSLISFWWYRNFNFWQRRKIPNVRGLFGGSFKELITFKTSVPLQMSRIYQDPKFENAAVIGIYFPHRPALLIRNPDLLKSVFVKDFSYFRTRFVRTENKSDLIGKPILFSAPYKLWKEMRSKITTMFSESSAKRLYPLIRKVGENLETHMKNIQSGSIIEMRNLTNLFTMDVINTTIFGIESNVLENPEDPLAMEMKRVSHFNAKRYFHLFLMTTLPQLTSILGVRVFYKETDEFLKTTTSILMAERERLGIKRWDLIDIFVKLKKEAETNGEDMTVFMNNITAQVGLLLFAGYDTSSTTLANALFELAKHPDIQTKLRVEIKQAFDEDTCEISYENLSKLKYMDMVLNETMRRYPPLPLLERQHNAADNGSLYSLQPYMDYRLPPGMPVYISTYGLHHDPKVCKLKINSLMLGQIEEHRNICKGFPTSIV